MVAVKTRSKDVMFLPESVFAAAKVRIYERGHEMIVFWRA